MYVRGPQHSITGGEIPPSIFIANTPILSMDEDCSQQNASYLVI